jgi:type IV secretory pathway VirB4 component
MAPPPSTTDLVQIKQIVDGVIVLKDGTLRAVVQVSAINFELRSSEEQAAILQQFQGFLNSVDFPIQMIVHSRKFDITAYLASVQQAVAELTSELLKVQAEEYMRFIKELSALANIMSKNFYVALPFQVTAAPTAKKGILSGVTGMFSKKKGAAQDGIPPEQLASYKVQLQQRADLLLGGLSGMGLKGHVMSQEELIALFNDLYNPKVPAAAKPPSA